jgi:predicted alpha-1,6-mannanase (GH76 family)
MRSRLRVLSYDLQTMLKARPLLFASALALLLGCETESGDSRPLTAGNGGQAGTAGAVGASGAAGAIGSAAGGSAGQSTTGPGGAASGSGLGGSAGAGGANSLGGAAGSGGGAGGGSPPVQLDELLLARVVAGMVPLQAWYNVGTGLFEENDWWTSGNQLTTVIDYTRETGDMTYFADIDNTFQKHKASNFDRHGFYDDDGWWALAWIKAYDLTQQQVYLDMAKTVFQRMAGSWDDKCNGGIYWRNQKDVKNAISNSLFMQTAAQLHLRTPGDSGAGSFLDWAQRTWTWFKGTGMLRSDKLVIDSLNGLTTCEAKGGTFSYNQGVLVGALVDLATSTGDAALLDEAGAIVRATMSSSSLQSSGVMTEPCGIDTKDCWQFKGVFFRNLLAYYRARPARDVQEYARRQSDSIWNVARNAQNQFGYHWHVAFDGASSRRQGSALDALLTAYAVSSPLP